jgi:sugar lactone lactonase YvrE
MRLRLLRTVAAAVLAVSLVPALAGAQPLGSSRVVAPTGAASYPEGIATHGNKFYVTGPATFGQPLGSAYVKAFDIRTGAPAGTYPITITNPFAGFSAASCAAVGPDGKLYVIEPTVGVIRMDLNKKNTQSVYAPFIPTGPSLLNDLAFDGAGNLYVTDSFAATIYRVPAGGGLPTVWFSDPRLSGDANVPFGVTVTAENGTLDGVIYRIPVSDSPAAAQLEEFHRYSFFTPNGPALAGPDGIAFGKSGKLYVALAGTSQISVLRPDGTEEARYSGPAANPGGVLNPLPWANPANIAFDDKNGSLLVTNHASLVPVDPTHLFAVFSVFVNDKGQPLP